MGENDDIDKFFDALNDRYREDEDSLEEEYYSTQLRETLEAQEREHSGKLDQEFDLTEDEFENIEDCFITIANIGIEKWDTKIYPLLDHKYHNDERVQSWLKSTQVIAPILSKHGLSGIKITKNQKRVLNNLLTTLKTDPFFQQLLQSYVEKVLKQFNHDEDSKKIFEQARYADNTFDTTKFYYFMKKQINTAYKGTTIEENELMVIDDLRLSIESIAGYGTIEIDSILPESDFINNVFVFTSKHDDFIRVYDKKHDNLLQMFYNAEMNQELFLTGISDLKFQKGEGILTMIGHLAPYAPPVLIIGNTVHATVDGLAIIPISLISNGQLVYAYLTQHDGSTKKVILKDGIIQDTFLQGQFKIKHIIDINLDNNKVIIITSYSDPIEIDIDLAFL